MANDSMYNIMEIMNLLPDNLEGKRILDVGFGCGTVIHKIVSTSGRPWSHFRGMPIVYGIDRDPELVDFALKWMPYYKKVFLQNATEIPYPKEIAEQGFDIIIGSETVEHWKDKKKAIETLKYLLTLAPLVIITCPNGDQTNILYKQEYHNHNLVWNTEDFERLGFKTKIISQYPKPIEILLRIIKPIFMREPLFRNIIAWKSSVVF